MQSSNEIPAPDWEVYANLRDLPLTLWTELRFGNLGNVEENGSTGKLNHGRVSVQLLGQDREIDSRLIARLYRGWWARVFFTSNTGDTLRNFVKRTDNWPRIGNRPEPIIKLARFLEVVQDRAPGPSSYRRLSSVVRKDLDGSMLQRVDERATDRLIEYGDSPKPEQIESLLAALMDAYLREPERYPRISLLLEDVFLPDFRTDEGNGQGYDDGRMEVKDRAKLRRSNKDVASEQL